MMLAPQSDPGCDCGIYFPPNPCVGSIVWGPRGRQWVWDGQKWNALGAGYGPDCPPTGPCTTNCVVVTGPTAPANPSDGQLWFDTNDEVLYLWDGTDWLAVGGQSTIPTGPTPPANPQDGQLWYNTSNGQTYVWDGTAWADVGNATAVGPTPPVNPVNGQLWLDSAGSLWVWDGTNWVQITSPVTGAYVSATPPPSPYMGQLWQNTTAGEMFVWTGSSWALVGGTGTQVSQTPPANPQPGELWLNPSTNQMYVWDGSSWVVVGPAPVPYVTTEQLNTALASYLTAAQAQTIYFPFTGGTITGPVSINSLLNVTGQLSGSNLVMSATAVVGGLQVQGGAVIGSTIQVGGPATMQGQLVVDGQTYLTSLSASNGAVITGGVQTDGVNCTGSITVGNNAIIQGNLNVVSGGINASEYCVVYNDGSSGAFEAHQTGQGGAYCFQCYSELTGFLIGFWWGGGSNTVEPTPIMPGSITTSGDGQSVIYGSASDARLKERDSDLVDAGPMIDALLPKRFYWKGRRKAQEHIGFFAQDVEKVLPEAVYKGRGKPGDEDYRCMVMDQSKLMPLVVAELKSLRGRIAELENGGTEKRKPRR